MTKEEFARQAENCRLTLYRVACAYLQNEMDRADAVQEALLKAWQGVKWLKEEAYFKTWLTRILIRECINIQRRQKRVVPVETVPERAAAPSEDPALREAILALPKELRITVVLHYMEGYTLDEIAKTLRVPRGTVASRLSRARQQLKNYLEEETV